MIISKVIVPIILAALIRQNMTNRIEASNGLVTVHDPTCEITINGEEEIVIDGKIPGLKFGIVNYSCRDGIGTIISKMSCNNCGLFCASNEMIDGCQSVALPMALGILIGTIVSGIIFWAFKSKISSGFLAILDCYNVKRQINKDNRHKKRVDKLNRLTGMTNDYSFIDEYHMTDKGRCKVMANREGLSMHLLVMSLLCIAGTAYCHDKTLFMHSTGKVCEDNRCTDSDMINFNLVSGNVLLLEDDQGKKIELTVAHTYYRHRYTYMYETSDYEGTTTHDYRCKAIGGMCWNGKCKPDSKFELWGNDTSQLIRYGCNVDTLGCDTWCVNQVSCTWYKFKITPKLPYYNVYEYQSKIWEVVLDINKDGFKTRNIINANNPMLNIQNIGKPNGSYPMLINSFLTEEYVTPKTVMEMGGQVYKVDACRTNFPMLDRIGDLQIDRNGKMTFPIDRITCTTSSCIAYCTMVDSPVRRLSVWKNEHMAIDYKAVVRNSIIETRVETRSSLNFMLQLNGFKQLDFSAAHCTFEVVSTFACNACNEKPFVILQPTKITHKGLLEVVSNCSMNTNILPCTGEPIMLSMQELPGYCEIHLIRTNQTIPIRFDYIYLGSVESMHSHLTFSTADEFSSLITSESFIYGIVTSATSIFGVGILATFILRLVYIIEVNKTVKEINNT